MDSAASTPMTEPWRPTQEFLAAIIAELRKAHLAGPKPGSLYLEVEISPEGAGHALPLRG